MPSPVKNNWNAWPNDYNFDSLNWIEMPIVSPGAGVASSTVQTRKLLPFACKVPIIAVYTGAIFAVDGSHQFNIVSGSGSYETGAVAAASTTTITGTPNHDGTVTVTIAGHAVVYTEVSGDTSPTALAGHLVTAINNDATAKVLVTASNIAGALTLTANTPGVGGNAITATIASTDSAPLTFTPASFPLTGGAAATGITVPSTDNSLTSAFNDGTGWGTSPTLGGLGVPTVFGAAGQALFSTDQPLSTTSGVGVAATTGQPALPIPATGADSFWRFVPTTYDAVWPACTLFTLRAITPATDGSITNMLVVLGMVPVRTKQSVESTANYVIPGVDL